MQGRPSPPLSQHEDRPSREYSHTPEPQTHSFTPYTPPRSHPGQDYSYADPEQYEMQPSQKNCYEQPPYYQQGNYRPPPLPINETPITTRSGRALGTPTSAASSPSSRISASPRAKRNKKGKEHATQISLLQPLSVETKDYDVPVRDMMAWANRSHEERHQEVSKQHKGNIPRPLNSFMLYRQAYKERIKKWGEQGNNNQLISRVAGVSWALEPAEVKEFYAKASIMERDNHADAFPDYKFAPNKNVSKKRDRNDDDEESDPEWDGGSVYGGKKRRNGREASEIRSRSSTPADLAYFPSPRYHPSSLQATNPQLMPQTMHYPAPWQPMQYEQYPGYGMMPYHDPVQDLHYAPTSMPIHHEQQYMHLVGMPPSNDGVMEGLPPAQVEYAIDPGLNEYQSSSSYQYGGYPNIDPHGEYEEEPEHVLHPGMQTLAPAEPMWSPSGRAGSAFDAELSTHWHGES